MVTPSLDTRPESVAGNEYPICKLVAALKQGQMSADTFGNVCGEQLKLGNAAGSKDLVRAIQVPGVLLRMAIRNRAAVRISFMGANSP
jgi:hypothetical protein